MTSKVALIILDGWGNGLPNDANAVHVAKTPYFDSLTAQYPTSTLVTSGLAVGLPPGQMGNSEVGHFTIGAGRVVYQDLVRINLAIEEGHFFNNEILLSAFNTAIKNRSKIHLIGLLSDGGVHSHINHLLALCTMAKDLNADSQTYIHAITDGRDTDPNGGIHYAQTLENHIAKTNIKIADTVGRYYAMDRDKRWERVKKAYDLYIHGHGNEADTLLEAIKKGYANGITDEFLEPTVINKNGKIETNDVVIFFNFRTDRGRELTQVLSQTPFPEHNMQPLPLHYYTFTNYDNTFKNVNVIYDKANLNDTLGEVLTKNNKTQLRLAETEKYPHVTFFFSGGRELIFGNEERIVVPSAKVATYDLQPEMSAKGIEEALIQAISTSQPDFIVANFANPDMVGHTGVFSAVVKACETVDECLSHIVPIALAHDYELIIIADHGNADYMKNADNSPNTAHTTNLVPCIMVSHTPKNIKDGTLADIAPTILELMQIKKPTEMTGNSLIQ